MKKIVVIAAAIIMMIVGAEQGQAQKSKMYSGDKSAREIKRSQQIFWNQINVYQDKVDDLKKDNNKFIQRVRYTRDSNEYYNYAYQIQDNDSLIKFYQGEINTLTQRAADFVAKATTKDQQNYLDLRGNNPTELANAYLIAAYANNMGQYKNAATAVANTDQNPTALKGVVQNLWQRDVIAKVTGPGNFYREFFLTPGAKSDIFELPFIGDYTATFISGNEVKSVVKKVGPNIVYYCKMPSGKTTPLDFLATLPPN
ncbi:MAG: hypothetical protein WC523_02980 [Patescibacteria group bacterium]